jgi:hypothetical protein
MSDSRPKDFATVVKMIAVVLAGRPPEIQSAILADLLATFLAGHIVRGNPAATNDIREKILASHVGLVRELVPINAAIIHGPEA